MKCPLKFHMELPKEKTSNSRYFLNLKYSDLEAGRL
jgi:hypothetical protein